MSISITLTSSDPYCAKAFTEELANLKRENSALSEVSFLVCQDPTHNFIGDGGSTLNALLITAEQLCCKRGLQSVTPNVLENSYIFILHLKNDGDSSSCYWPNQTFSLPVKYRDHNSYDIHLYIQYIIELCLKAKTSLPPGVWIMSLNQILYGDLLPPLDWSIIPSPTALMITLKSDLNNLTKSCDVVQFNKENGIVEAIIPGSAAVLDYYHEWEANESAGIVYIASSVAEKLLLLSCKFPLDNCTYLGEDSGGSGNLELSLYYDLLGPLWMKDKDTFLKGVYKSQLTNGAQKKKEINEVAVAQARLLLWEELHNDQLFALIENRFQQVNWGGLSLEKVFQRPPFSLFGANDTDNMHSFIRYSTSSIISVNSFIGSKVELGINNAIYTISSRVKSSLNSEQILRSRGTSYLINVDIDLDQVPSFYLNDGVCIIGHWIRLENQLKLGVSLFSAKDIPTVERTDSRATVFGFNWSKFFAMKGIEATDVWTNTEAQSLKTARLFPLAEDENSWNDLLWLQEEDASRLESWRNRKRYSIEDFCRLRDLHAAQSKIRSVTTAAILESIGDFSGPLFPYLRRSCAEEWSDKLLLTLDQLALRGGNHSSRALAAIADLLACKAGWYESGLRSGPASNKEWLPAFQILENHLENGVLALAKVRANWMDCAERLVRAARHYERAVHILIRKRVKSVQNYMVAHLKIRNLVDRPPIGVWVEAKCPARIDLSGGWSDTPPVCYELGGSVVNIAILVDGQKPIGVRGRRIEKRHLVLVSEGQPNPLVISSLNEVMNYENPSLPGALLKAALVCSGVVVDDSDKDLSTQLELTVGGGLELHSWSNLPQGSGLGTSSILASALLAVIYTMMGVQFNRSHLIHAVLHVEQLLTTGGGWQDQIGGTIGGCKRGYSFSQTELHVHVENINLHESTIRQIDERLLLIHTGKVRLARNLLQNVIRLWYARDKTTVACFHQLVDNAEACKNALLQGDFVGFGNSVNSYWSQKKTIAPGCEPQIVKSLMERMIPFVQGQSLAGAGGGGFYYGFLKNPKDRETVGNILKQLKECSEMTIHTATIDTTGISLLIGGRDYIIPHEGEMN